MIKKKRNATNRRPPSAKHPRRMQYVAVYGTFVGRKKISFYSANDANAKRYAEGLLAQKMGRAPNALYATGNREAPKKKKNPKRRYSNRQVAQAIAAFEEFTGHPVERVEGIELVEHDAGWLLGPVSQINYIATRDGETVEYEHRFAARSRPQLIASSDGSQLYLLSGAYRVTDKGIEDR